MIPPINIPSEEDGVHVHYYRVTINNPTHNHEPSWHPLAHAIHRRRTEYIKDTINAETRAGVKAKQIMIRLTEGTLQYRLRGRTSIMR
jgi:hypothetical protein